MPQPLTDQRKRIFCETLAKTGSMAAAAEAATPWATGEKHGYETFRDAIRRDPEFALAVENAKQAALASVEQMIVERAMNPPTKPYFERGKLMGFTEDRMSSDKLLLSLARKLNPNDWIEKKAVEHSGSVAHAHAHAVAVLSPADVMVLDEEDREAFMGLLEKIAERRPQDEPEHPDRGRALEERRAPAD